MNKEIEFYLSDFKKNETVLAESVINEVQKQLDFELPKDYLDLVREYNGQEGDVRDGGLCLFPIEELAEINNDYCYLMEEIPDFFLFGKDYAVTVYAFHKKNHTYHEFGDLSNFDVDPIEFCGNNILEFLNYLYNVRNVSDLSDEQLIAKINTPFTFSQLDRLLSCLPEHIRNPIMKEQWHKLLTVQTSTKLLPKPVEMQMNKNKELEFYLRNFEKNKTFIPESVINDVQKQLDFELPKDYVDFVREYNGCEGDVREGGLCLFPLEELLLANNDYYGLLMADIPEFFLFATDYADTGYAFHKKNYTYHAFGLMSNFKTDRITFCGNNILEFLHYLYYVRNV